MFIYALGDSFVGEPYSYTYYSTKEKAINALEEQLKKYNLKSIAEHDPYYSIHESNNTIKVTSKDNWDYMSINSDNYNYCIEMVEVL